MPKKDPRIDAYIAKAAEFARPILKYIRKAVHQACPDVEETLKWKCPGFMYQGLLCGMAAFQNHCTFGFWKWDVMFKDDKEMKKRAEQAMGNFGRVTSLSELPDEKALIAYVKEAMRLNEEGIKRPKPAPKPRVELTIPDYLSSALKKNSRALATFENFSYSHKKEYVEWLTEAKRDETRKQRLETAVAWMAQGKARNWKYVNC